MVILGLTGSIGMGKTVAAGMFRRLGIPVHDADAAVHRLLGRRGGAVAAVAAAFPGVLREGAIDRRELGRRVFDDAAAIGRLEGVLHPAVRADQAAFLRRQARRGCKLAVLDVPLLFETGADGNCDAVAVVMAPPFVQEARVLARPGMTRQRLEAIRARQMADAEKRRRADFLIPSGLGRRETLRAIMRIAAQARTLRPCRWPWPAAACP
ncbi:dephospho-CoA kinase [Shumkonia mesophila]|uniref:dephospho-CoA kinase n=1 Tax=Shumkonia mesophila TaxID=2838854 RepID=UPI002934C9FD|nr:dephospho-CoA kinase [Shumkonia mesophila]